MITQDTLYSQAFSLLLVSDTYLVSLIDMESEELDQLRQITAGDGQMSEYERRMAEQETQKADLEKRIDQTR